MNSENQRHFIIVSVLVVLSTLLMRAILDASLPLPTAASDESLIIDRLIAQHVWLIAFLFSLVMVFMLYAIVVFRRRDGDEGDGEFTHGNTRLEIAWTVLPLLIVIVFSWIGTSALAQVTHKGENELEVRVIGFQWGWRFEYPDLGNLATTEMVVPKGRRILLRMSALDVLHSFWVPEFRVKQDLVPGQETELRFTPIQVGEYKVRCAELCGTRHFAMLAPVRVVEPAEYDAWAAEMSRPVSLTPEELGAQVAQQQGCIACHSLDGTVLVGPSWQGLFGHEVELESGEVVIADEEYIRQSILEPNAQIVKGFPANVMLQNYGDLLSEEQIAALIAYIKTLE